MTCCWYGYFIREKGFKKMDMKKVLLIGFGAFCFSAFAQPQQEKKWVFGIHGGFNQYNGELGNGWYTNTQAAYSFGGISVSRFLTRHFDVTLFGSRGDLGYQGPWGDGNNDFLIRKTTLQLLGRYYILGREPFFQPFLLAGGGLLFQRPRGDNFYPSQKKFDLAIPSAGLGFNLRLTRWMRLQLQEIFIHTSADYVDYRQGGGNDLYVMHTAGLIFNVPSLKSDRGDRSELIVDDCPKLPKELAAKRAAKKRMKTKAKMDRKSDKD
jgi:OmpA-OmpF porin, OOP family